MPVDVLLRSEKGSQLNTTEVDQNFTDLQDSVNIARGETVTETSVAITASNKRIILADATANDITVTLPSAATSLDVPYTIKKIDNTTNIVIIEGDGGDTIDNDLNQVIRDQYEGITMVSDGAEWYVVNKKSNAPLTVGVKTTTTTVTNTVTETLLYSYDFNANSFAQHEIIKSVISGSFSNDSASDDFTINVKLNGTIMHSLPRVGGNVIDSGFKVEVEGTIRTIGASGTYVDIASLSDGNVITQALASEVTIDTTVPLTYEIFVQWDAAKTGNTISCTQGSMTLIR